MNHDHYMELALRAGEEAMARGDWPTGSVVVLDGKVAGSGQNRQVSRHDITPMGSNAGSSGASCRRSTIS